jgi:MYXO-CTERM domain-containing protein
LLKATAPSQVSIVREPLGATDWGALVLNESGQLGFRATLAGSRAYVLLTPKTGGGFDTRYLAKEKGLDGTYEFLYSPTLNDRGQMAGVGDLAPATAEYFQELRIFNSNGTSTRIVQSRGQSPSSPIFRFASVAPALNGNGQVAFLGFAKSATNTNLTTLWLWDGSGLRVLAQDGQGEIGSLEFFTPDMNDSGLVVFRAFDSEGLRAVWVTDGVLMKRVVGEHQILPSDLGEARVDQETANNPVLAGAPMINARGDVSFVAGLAPPDNDQVEWGTAIYIARSSLPPPGPPDAGVDGGSGGLPDAGVDGGSGGTPDAGGDAGTGGTPDAGVDGGSGQKPDAGVDAGPSTPPDAGSVADAGTGEQTDAGRLTDAGPGEAPDAGGSMPPPEDVPDSGCGCQAAPAVVLWPWLFLGLARYVSARRRRNAARD